MGAGSAASASTGPASARSASTHKGFPFQGGYDPPIQAVREAVGRALAEDLLPLGDLSASLVPTGSNARFALVARRGGVIAGRLCAMEAFSAMDPAICVSWGLPDGSEVSPGDRIAIVAGPLAPILTAERTALNFLCHLSGVATLTRAFVDVTTAANPVTRVLDTRKTTPGLRSLEKAAVRAGGGFNHRGSLSEAVMVKDNHLAGLGITEAVESARRRWPGRMVEVECEDPAQVIEAVNAGATVVMLDNMDEESVAHCVGLVASSGASGRVLVEVSGRVTIETAPKFAKAGADLISVGALTHSAPVLDIGLDLLTDVDPVPDGSENEGPENEGIA
jgi:nicotinate-nucleotide pyrophosphorylase (carboxylating)